MQAGDVVAETTVDRVRRRVAEDPALAAGAGAIGLADVRSAVARAVRAEGVLLRHEQLATLVRDMTDDVAGLGPVEGLLRDPQVTDVLINGPHDIWVERAGVLARTNLKYPSADALRAAVLRVIGPLGLRLDRAQPYVDARLADGSRLHAVIAPLAGDGPLVTIRRFAAVTMTWDDLASSGAVPGEAADILRAAVAQRRSIVCCGRTGTGKTTLLNVLLGDISDDERVVVIEDAPELRPGCTHAVRLETRLANAEGAGAVDIRQLVRQALRMRPDRIVVGEVRGPEITDLLQALATGHEGCMTTVHARAADEALVRMEGMALQAGIPLPAARAQLAVGLDLIVVCSRDRTGRRGLAQIAELVPGTGAQAPVVRYLWRRASW